VIFKPGVSEQELFLYEYPIFSFDN
jgi:hypothetical protein